MLAMRMEGLLLYLRNIMQQGTRANATAQINQHEINQTTLYAILILIGCLIPSASKNEMDSNLAAGSIIEDLIRSVKMYVVPR
jgi:hypothetical protein